VLKIDIKKYLKLKKITQVELAKKINLTEQNLSKMLNGTTEYISIDKIDKILNILDCKPEDIFIFEKNKRIIPIFLDYSGTTDLLVKGGIDNFKSFLDSISSLERRINSTSGKEYEIRLIITTGADYKKAIAKFEPLHILAKNYGLNNLFSTVIAEFATYEINFNKGVAEKKKLISLDPVIAQNKDKIEKIVSKYNGRLSSDVAGSINIHFYSKEDILKEYYEKKGLNYLEIKNILDGISVEKEYEKIDKTGLPNTISKEEMIMVKEDIRKLFPNQKIDIIINHDEYGIECDIKNENNTKYMAVEKILDEIKENNEIGMVIIGGTFKKEDINIYTYCKERFSKDGIEVLMIIPDTSKNVTKEILDDKNVILADWTNNKGITNGIDTITKRIKVNSRGDIYYDN